MKNPYEVLRMKELEIMRLKKEIEALQITARLLGEDAPVNGDDRRDTRHLVEMP